MPDAQTHEGQRSPARRTIVKGAAWAVPAIAVAAPAHAVGASQCVVQTTFDNLKLGTCVGAIGFPPSAVTANVTYSYSSGVPSGQRGDTCEVERTTTNPPFSYVEIEMLNPIYAGDYIDVTITLSQAMENLSFTIHDIDSSSGGYRDDIIILTSNWTAERGSTITGSGTDASPYRRSSWGDNPINSGSGAVRVTWAGPIQSVSFRYRAGITGNSQNQHVALSRISFSDCLEGEQARFPITVPDGPAMSTKSSEDSDGVMRDL